MDTRAPDDSNNTVEEHGGGDAACWAHIGDGTTPLGPVSWESFVHRLADAVLIADTEGTITYWNAGAERLFGWSAGEATGRSLDLIIPEKYRRRHGKGYANTVRTGVTRYADQLLEVPALHRDGRRISIAFTVTLLTDDSGRVVRVAAVVRDETQRRQERQRLLAAAAEREAPGPRPS